MDTFLAVTEVDAAAAEGGLQRAREQLRKFSFAAVRDDEVIRAKSTEAAERWAAFLRGELPAGVEALRARPYDWRRIVGNVTIARREHGIEVFIYPLSQAKAAVSVAFFESLHDAIYSSRPSYEKSIDFEAKEDFLSLFLILTRAFSAGAFALRRLEQMPDLVAPLTQADISDWLARPTPALVQRLQILVAGVRTGVLMREQIEKAWQGGRIIDGVHDFLIYDRID